MDEEHRQLERKQLTKDILPLDLLKLRRAGEDVGLLVGDVVSIGGMNYRFGPSRRGLGVYTWCGQPCPVKAQIIKFDYWADKEGFQHPRKTYRRIIAQLPIPYKWNPSTVACSRSIQQGQVTHLF